MGEVVMRTNHERGEARYNARLTTEKVIEIRENRYGWSAKRQAEHYGVHHNTIHRVRHFEAWSHV